MATWILDYLIPQSFNNNCVFYVSVFYQVIAYDIPFNILMSSHIRLSASKMTAKHFLCKRSWSGYFLMSFTRSISLTGNQNTVGFMHS